MYNNDSLIVSFYLTFSHDSGFVLCWEIKDNLSTETVVDNCNTTNIFCYSIHQTFNFVM